MSLNANYIQYNDMDTKFGGRTDNIRAYQTVQRNVKSIKQLVCHHNVNYTLQQLTKGAESSQIICYSKFLGVIVYSYNFTSNFIPPLSVFYTACYHNISSNMHIHNVQHLNTNSLTNTNFLVALLTAV